MCLIMGLLDMKGLLGAATVMVHGAGHVWAGRANFYPHQRKQTKKRPLSFFWVASANRARGMVGQLISSCWRADKCAKDWMSKSKTNQRLLVNRLRVIGIQSWMVR